MITKRSRIVAGAAAVMVPLGTVAAFHVSGGPHAAALGAVTLSPSVQHAARAYQQGVVVSAAQQVLGAAAGPVTASKPSPPPVYAAPSPGTAQAVAYSMLPSFGFGQSGQWACLLALWNQESGWNVYAEEPTSGAYGIPQALPGWKMATAGADWQTSATTQVTWGLGYIKAVYGTPCGAEQHELDYHYY